MSEAKGRVNLGSEIELIPGKLFATVHEHTIDTGTAELPCWSYVTRGLAGLQQKELVLTVARRGDLQTPPREPLDFFANVYVYALRGQLVDSGDVSEIGAGGSILGSQCVLYLPAQKLKGVELPEPALACVLLAGEELETARRFGPMRVVNRLALAYGFYPFPPWSDPHRRPLCFDATNERSLLAGMKVCGHARARIMLGASEIVLRVDPRATTELRDRIRPIPELESLALWTGPDSSANASLAWNPECSDSDGPPTAGIVLPSPTAASSVAGCFLACVVGQAQNSCRAIEDGFELKLSNEAWARLRPALMSGRPITIPLSGDIRFRLEWCRENQSLLLDGAPFESAGRVDLALNVQAEPLGDTYSSPLDGEQYHASGGWTRYTPDASAEPELPEGPAELQEIILLTPEQELGERLSVKDLGDFSKQTLRVIQDYFAAFQAGDPQQLCAEFRLQPGGAVGVKLGAQPGLPDEVLQPLRLELLNLVGPAVQGGPVAYQLCLLLWGDSTPAASQH